VNGDVLSAFVHGLPLGNGCSKIANIRRVGEEGKLLKSRRRLLGLWGDYSLPIELGGGESLLMAFNPW
jgi:hypothetical protein